MAMEVSDHQYDLRVKGQGQLYLKSVLRIVLRKYHSFLMEDVHI